MTEDQIRRLPGYVQRHIANLLARIVELEAVDREPPGRTRWVLEGANSEAWPDRYFIDARIDDNDLLLVGSDRLTSERVASNSLRVRLDVGAAVLPERRADA